MNTQVAIVGGGLAGLVAARRLHEAGVCWGRLPGGINLEAHVGEQGATIWVKFGPLLHGSVCSLSKLD